MATVLTRPSNGTSYGTRYTVTATDATDELITIDYQVRYDLAGVVQILRAGVDVTGDAEITYPANGQIAIANGSTYELTEDDVICIVANRAI